MNVYEGAKDYIFVSYSHSDSDVVFPVIRKMQAEGFRIWFDSGIEVGSEWPEYIESHLLGCARFLAFISPASVASPNCRNEINLARTVNKEMLVAYLEPTTLAGGMLLQLNSVQAINRHAHPNDESFGDALCRAKIIASCREESAVPTEAPTEEAPQAVSETAEEKEGYHTVTLHRSAAWGGALAKITAEFSNGHVYLIKNGESRAISLPEGEYTVRFSFKDGPVTERVIRLDKDVALELAIEKTEVLVEQMGLSEEELLADCAEDSVVLTFTRPAQFSLLHSDMKVTLDGVDTHLIRPSASITFPVLRGEHSVEITWMMHKKLLTIHADRNMELLLGTNRITGEIEVEMR